MHIKKSTDTEKQLQQLHHLESWKMMQLLQNHGISASTGIMEEVATCCHVPTRHRSVLNLWTHPRLTLSKSQSSFKMLCGLCSSAVANCGTSKGKCQLSMVTLKLWVTTWELPERVYWKLLCFVYFIVYFTLQSNSELTRGRILPMSLTLQLSAFSQTHSSLSGC